MSCAPAATLKDRTVPCDVTGKWPLYIGKASPMYDLVHVYFLALLCHRRALNIKYA